MAQKKEIYDQLRQDHVKVKQVLEKMVATSEKATKERVRLLNLLKKELLAHAHAEENVLYHELEQHKESKEIALEGEEEHHVAEHVLAELEQTDPADPHWKAKAKVLKELIEHHVEEEEEELFPQAQQLLDPEQAQEMGRRFLQQKQQEQERL